MQNKRNLHLLAALPISIAATGIIIGMFSLATLVRMAINLATDEGYLYYMLGVLLGCTIIPLIIFFAGKWNEKQLYVMAIFIKFTAAIIGYFFVFSMPSIDILWSDDFIDFWNPFSSSVSVGLILSTLGTQCISLCLNFIIFRRLVSIRSIIMQPSKNVGISFLKSNPINSDTRVDLGFTALFLTIIGLIGLFPSGGTAKYYLSILLVLDLLLVVFFSISKPNLPHAARKKDIQKILHEFDEKERLDKKNIGVPGRISFLIGYLFLFLISSTPFMQKNNGGKDIDILVMSIGYLLPAIGITFILSWVARMKGYYSPWVWYAGTIIFVAIPWVFALLEPEMSFTSFESPFIWFLFGIAIGFCMQGIWGLLWPVKSNKSWRLSGFLMIFVILILIFVNGALDVNFNSNNYMLFAAIFAGSIFLCFFLGIIGYIRLSTKKSPSTKEKITSEPAVNP